MTLVTNAELELVTTLCALGIVDFDFLLKCVRANTEYLYGDDKF